MIDKNKLDASPMGSALKEFETELQKRNLPHITLNVVGGFALMLREQRNINDFTDIDFVGNDLPEEIKKLADEIGVKYKLGYGWINNDVMLSGNTLEDFEFATGKLHFEPYMSTDQLTVNVLTLNDLLRMKIIAIDTSISAVELGGDFTRMKDIPDVLKLSEELKKDIKDLRIEFSEYIESKDTIKVIKTYQEKGPEAVTQMIAETAKKNLEKLHINNTKPQNTQFLDSLVSDLMKGKSSLPESIKNFMNNSKDATTDNKEPKI